MGKKIIRVIAVVLIPVVCLYLLTLLLTPKYVNDIPEGSMIAEYYKSEKNNDVLILGDCEVYENISTVKMWEEYGITSYIRGSSEQLIWQSYYLLEDTLKHETPKVVVLSMLAMSEADAKSEAYNRMTLDGMRWSKSKWNSIKESMTEKETMASYIFPLLRYHSRWSELSSDDIKYMFNKPKVTSNGYLMQVGVRPVTTVPKVSPLANYTFSDRNYEYLDKIKDLCNEKGIKLVLIKAPSIFPHWYDEWESQIQDYANENNLLYLNMVDKADEIGLDYTTDTFDYGQHLNVDGAEKTAVYLGNILKDQYRLTDHRGESETASQWNKIVSDYNSLKTKKQEAWNNSLNGGSQ